MKQSEQESIMRQVIELAAKAIKMGNSPYGAILINSAGKVMFKAYNTKESKKDPTAHAEMNLLRQACKKLNTLDLSGYCLFANAESCSMCMSAAIKANIQTFYFGAPNGQAYMNMDPLLPAEFVASKSRKNISITLGILANECAKQIKDAKEATKK